MTAPRRSTEREASEHAQEFVQIVDPADAMLEAHSEITRLAYRKYVQRKRKPGHALDDWLAAERELSLPIRVEISESEYFIHALANLPNVSAEQIFVAIDARMVLLLVRSRHLDVPADSTGDISYCTARHHIEFFNIFDLSAGVNSARSIAILSDGVLAIRMSKIPQI